MLSRSDGNKTIALLPHHETLGFYDYLRLVGDRCQLHGKNASEDRIEVEGLHHGIQKWKEAIVSKGAAEALVISRKSLHRSRTSSNVQNLLVTVDIQSDHHLMDSVL